MPPKRAKRAQAASPLLKAKDDVRTGTQAPSLASRLSTFETLPKELFLEIISYYDDPLDNTDRTRVLRALSRLNCAFRKLFLPYLWERLDAGKLEHAQSAWYKRISSTLERRCLGLAQTQELQSFVRVATLILTHESSATCFPALAACLTQLPNLHTIELAHVQNSMSTTIKTYFVDTGLQLNTVQTVILPGSAYYLLLCCPKAKKIVCRGESYLVIAPIEKCCKEVEIFEGTLYLGHKHYKRLSKAAPKLRSIAVLDSISVSAMESFGSLKHLSTIDIVKTIWAGPVTEAAVQRVINAARQVLNRNKEHVGPECRDEYTVRIRALKRQYHQGGEQLGTVLKSY